VLNFLIGLLLGGCIAAVILCCIQINPYLSLLAGNPQAQRKTE